MDVSAIAGKSLVFTLDRGQFALLLSSVLRVVRAVEITPLPQAPEIILGVVNLQGALVPVIDVRRRFGLPGRAVRLEDRLILAVTPRRTLALPVDSVAGVKEAGRPAATENLASLAGP